jgi:hypothetical protein
MRERDHWTRSRRGEPDDRRDWRGGEPADDYGQADYSADYAYDPVHRTGYRAADQYDDRRDFGQVDYSDDYTYDPEARRGYRRHDSPHDGYGSVERGPSNRAQDWREEQRSWDHGHRRRVRHGASDPVIWTVVTQRLDNERGLDASHIEVSVENAEVTLNGFVRDRQDKRRAEDLAELHDVRHVQNNLRVREGWRRRFGF